MCQLIRFRVSHRAAFAEALSRIPAEMWVTAHDDRARSSEPGALWATLAAFDVMREPVGAIRGGEGRVDDVARATGLGAEDLLAWQPPFSPPYVWLLIRRREDALPAASGLFPGNAAARQWAERFGVSSLPALLSRAQPGIPPKLVPEPA